MASFGIGFIVLLYVLNTFQGSGEASPLGGKCQPGEFQCANGKCILKQLRCDKVDDCGDGSDETKCPCKKDERKCDGECKPSYYWCDGFLQCKDFSDEQNCKCGVDDLVCANRICKHFSFWCDDHNDCGDLSDEVDCTCEKFQRRCKNGMCVNETYWCNGQNNCGDNSDERVCGEAEVRFAYGFPPHRGRVEVKVKGEWGTICDDLFDNKDATVLCRMMGYHGTGHHLYWEVNPGKGTIWMDDLKCIGNETSILHCGHSGLSQHNCNHKQDVSIACHNKPLIGHEATGPVQVRLEYGDTDNSGRVEVKVNGEWGTVCMNDFDVRDAQVLCRMMGYYGPAKYFHWEQQKGYGPIWFDGLQCTGHESSILECKHKGVGKHTCDHSQDISIFCQYRIQSENLPNTVLVRLADGNETHGRPEVLIKGQWGTICKNNFDSMDASILCRMMGFYGSSRYNRHISNPGKGRIWLDKLNCTGYESSILDCGRNQLGVHHCNHEQDVSISCSYHSLIPDSCLANEKTCGNYQCIKEEKWCDGTTDCADNTDETDCTP